MLSSINPLGERARRQRFWITVGWYLLGSLLGGIAIGALSGLGGSLLPSGTWRAVAAVLVCLAGATLDLIGRTPPSIHRQVDENWLPRYRGWVYGLGFGFQLGLGVATIVTTASVYTTVALAILSGSMALGALIGAVFGLARAVAIFLVVGARDPETLRQVMRRLQDRLTTARLFAVGAQAIAAAAAVLFIVG
jgi:hypothetical protein